MPSQPNVIFLSLDSVRADACSFLNEDGPPTTPILDGLADDAARFSTAVSPTIWTQPSHASLFTGLYPHEHQLRGGDEVLGDHPTLAELLRDTGWATHAYGYNAWTRTKGVGRGFTYHLTPHPREKYSGISRRLFQAKRLVDRVTYHRLTRDETTIQRLVDKIEAVDEPFFGFAHLMGPHHVYLPRSPYYQPFTSRSRFELSWNQYRQRKLFSHRPEVYAGEYWPSDRTIAVMKEQYFGCIRQADSLIGDVVNVLQKRGLWENTIFVVFGDHGECFGEDGVFGHQFTLDDAALRVPLLIRDPTGTIPPGEYNEIVQLNDLYPTITSLCGVDAPATNSVSIGEATRDTAFVNYTAPVPAVERNQRLAPSKRPLSKRYAAWRSNDEKLYWYPDDEKYDGPSANDEKLRKRFRAHLSSLEPVPTIGEEGMTAEVEENLRQMGYL